MTNSAAQLPHNSAHDASHQPWEYGRGAAIWGSDGVPLAVNMTSHATHMHAWLRRETNSLWQGGAYVDPALECQRNPYSESLVTLSSSIALIIDDICNFTESPSDITGPEVEIRRIRLEGELVLHAARFCEASIKQMLHCTAFPAKLYRNAALGQLLALDCKSCRAANHPTHQFSLVGSLAHHFFLCDEFDGCALDHLTLANRRRNIEAAHSNAQKLNACTTTQSREAMKQTLDKVAGDFAHLLSHISKVEAAMVREIRLRLIHYPRMPPQSAYNHFLTRTASDYDETGVYRGFGYRDERRARIEALRTTRPADPGADAEDTL